MFSNTFFFFLLKTLFSLPLLFISHNRNVFAKKGKLRFCSKLLQKSLFSSFHVNFSRFNVQQ